MNSGLHILAALCMAFASTAAPAGSKINTSFFGNKAIDGYDPVAYFTEARPTRGDKKFVLEYADANWHFANEANRELFRAAPDKYIPQYGGYCAYAVGAKNSLAGIDPEAWTITRGKLYLNFNKPIRAKWLARRDEFIAEGDRNWPALAAD